MTNLMVSFCNVFPPGLALGIYDFDADRFKWIELASIGENWVGVDGICRRTDGYWVLAQAAWGGVSALAFVNLELNLSRSYPLVQAGDAHSLIAYRDGFLITDTHHDRLVFAQIVDEGRAVAETEYWRYGVAGTGLDTVHLNGVIELDGDIYVSVFGPKPPEGWLTATRGQIINISRDEIVCEGLNHPHTLVNVDGTLYWLESRRGLVHRFSKASGHQVVLQLQGYLRGLAYDNEYLYVGASARRRRSRSTGANIPASENPDDVHSWIYRIRRNDLRIERRPLTRWGAEIYDLAPVSVGFLSFPDMDSQAVVQRLWRFEDELLRLRDERDILDDALRSSLRQLVEREHYQQALPILESLCEKQPPDSEWNYLLAFCLHRLGREWPRALKHYELALAHGFDEFWVRYNRGSLHSALGNYEAACADLERAVELQPAFEPARNEYLLALGQKARRLVDNQQFEDGLQIVKRLLNIQPQHPEGNYLAAFCFQRLGKEPDKALRHYEIALAHEFDEFWVRLNRGALLRDLGRLDAARDDLERAVQLQPDYPTAQEVLHSVLDLLERA